MTWKFTKSFGFIGFYHEHDTYDILVVNHRCTLCNQEAPGFMQLQYNLMDIIPDYDTMYTYNYDLIMFYPFLNKDNSSEITIIDKELNEIYLFSKEFNRFFANIYSYGAKALLSWHGYTVYTDYYDFDQQPLFTVMFYILAGGYLGVIIASLIRIFQGK